MLQHQLPRRKQRKWTSTRIAWMGNHLCCRRGCQNVKYSAYGLCSTRSDWLTIKVCKLMPGSFYLILCSGRSEQQQAGNTRELSLDFPRSQIWSSRFATSSLLKHPEDRRSE